jgi:hypothetical protein
MTTWAEEVTAGLETNASMGSAVSSGEVKAAPEDRNGSPSLADDTEDGRGDWGRFRFFKFSPERASSGDVPLADRLEDVPAFRPTAPEGGGWLTPTSATPGDCGSEQGSVKIAEGSIVVGDRRWGVPGCVSEPDDEGSSRRRSWRSVEGERGFWTVAIDRVKSERSVGPRSLSVEAWVEGRVTPGCKEGSPFHAPSVTFGDSDGGASMPREAIWSKGAPWS